MHISDHDDVRDLCMGLWGERDYIPDRFPQWIDSDSMHPFGVFQNNRLVAIGALQVTPEKKKAWIKGLRVQLESQQKGLGSRITEHLMDYARQVGVKTLRYGTSTRNKASMGLAEKLGFRLTNSVSYLRLEPPFPAHPTPSPSFVPLEIGPERFQEILAISPDLIESETFAFSWEFYNKDLEGIRQATELGKVRVVIDDTGGTNTIFLSRIGLMNDMRTSVYSIFSKNRSVFVDVFSRILDELEETKTDRGAFFLGPRAEEWVQYMVDIPAEYKGRRFMLYEMSL
ncbi:MAG: GNAT family N-acetyltransferase [Candidatus Thorarchaeota archaeon]|nr:MAG: GNAT family N-acetyltransferase [Candidatus Thorarchaeota archaeon]